MTGEFERRHGRVLTALKAIPGIECRPGRGAFYLLPDVAGAIERLATGDDVRFCQELLERAGLALVPGTAFGAPGHLRVSFAAADAVLDDAMHRLRGFVEETL